MTTNPTAPRSRWRPGARDTAAYRVRGITTMQPGDLPGRIAAALAARGYVDTTAEEIRANARRACLRPDRYTRVFQRGDVRVTVNDQPARAGAGPFLCVVAMRPRRIGTLQLITT